MAKAHRIKPSQARWLEVLKVTMPLCLSYLPIGVACGILLHAAGMNFLLTLLVSLVVFSGGAQFILASLLVINAPISAIFMTLFFLELRYALLGSSLSKYLRTEPQRFIFFFSASMNDENYAVNYLKFATDKNWTPKDALWVEYYSLAAWAGGNMIGGMIGSAVTIDLEIVDFALTALFIYMIVMQARNRLTLLIGFLSAGLSLVALTALKSTLGIIVATLLASLTGFLIENRVRRYAKDPNQTWILGRLFRPLATRRTVEERREEQAEKREEKLEERELQATSSPASSAGSAPAADSTTRGGHA